MFMSPLGSYSTVAHLAVYLWELPERMRILLQDSWSIQKRVRERLQGCRLLRVLEAPGLVLDVFKAKGA